MVVWWSVTSVTGNIEVMDTYLKSKKKTIFSIAANNAKNVRRYSAFPKEEERIIPPGTVFVVESILTISPGVSMVQLKQDDTPSLIDIGEDIYAICDPSTDPADGGDEESYATIELEAGNAVGGEEWYMGRLQVPWQRNWSCRRHLERFWFGSRRARRATTRSPSTGGKPIRTTGSIKKGVHTSSQSG